MNFNDEVKDVLNKTADFLEQPGKWTKGVFARNAKGHSVGLLDADATCFCLVGALYTVAHGKDYMHELAALQNAACRAISANIRASGHMFVAYWNDDKDRTQEEVVALLRTSAGQF